MVTSVMLARQITHPSAPNRANSFPPTLLRSLQLSCRSFCNSLPLFSIACSLFSQNTGGGGIHCPLPTIHYPLSAPFVFTTIQIPPPARSISRSFIFIRLQNPSLATPFFSHPCKSQGGCGVLPSYGQAFAYRALFDPLSP
jgi:hypothetical protein